MAARKKATTGILRLCLTAVCRSNEYSCCSQHGTRSECHFLVELFKAYRNIIISSSRIFLLQGDVEIFTHFGECIFGWRPGSRGWISCKRGLTFRLIQSLTKLVRLAWTVHWLRRPQLEADHSPLCIVERGAGGAGAEVKGFTLCTTLGFWLTIIYLS
jgi:hypothetical protein